ncbi:hypothetical protein Tco_0740090 [Tanacetum coccineum]
MTYTTSTTKTKAAQYDLPGIYQALKTWFQTYGVLLKLLMINMRYESRGDVYSTKRILAVTHVSVMRKHRYGYLEEIVVRRADHINVTKPDTTRPDLRKRHSYTPYKDPQGFIYVNDFERNRLMRFDELYKFSDGTLTRLLSTLEDITKNINMRYLPKRRWSKLEKKRAHFMIKDINKLLKERRMMRSLEKFVGCRLYGTDLRLLFDTSAGNPIKEILLKLNLPDHWSILTDSKMEVKRQSVKVKEIQGRCIIKAFQDYQIKKGMSMSVQKSQVHEMAK